MRMKRRRPLHKDKKKKKMKQEGGFEAEIGPILESLQTSEEMEGSLILEDSPRGEELLRNTALNCLPSFGNKPPSELEIRKKMEELKEKERAQLLMGQFQSAMNIIINNKNKKLNNSNFTDIPWVFDAQDDEDDEDYQENEEENEEDGSGDSDDEIALIDEEKEDENDNKPKLRSPKVTTNKTNGRKRPKIDASGTKKAK